MANTKRLDPSTIKKIYLMYKQDATPADISLETGVSESIVKSTIKLVKKYWNPRLKTERTNVYLKAVQDIRVHYLNQGRLKRNAGKVSLPIVEDDLLKDPEENSYSTPKKQSSVLKDMGFISKEEPKDEPNKPVTVHALIQQKVRAVEIALEDLLRVFGA